MTTAEMKHRATYAGWDFVNTWRITENATYPLLRSAPHTLLFSRTQSLTMSGAGWGDAGLFNCGLGQWDASTSGYGTFSLSYPLQYNADNGGGYYGLVVNDRTLGRFVEVVWLWDDDLN